VPCKEEEEEIEEENKGRHKKRAANGRSGKRMPDAIKKGKAQPKNERLQTLEG